MAHQIVCSCGCSFPVRILTPDVGYRCPQCGNMTQGVAPSPHPQKSSPGANRVWYLTGVAVLIIGGIVGWMTYFGPARAADPGWDRIANARGFKATEVAADDARSADKVALLIGVNGYTNLSTLSFAERDVERLGRVLAEQGYKVTLMTTKQGASDAALAPTGANIKHQVALLAQSGKAGGVVLVGFAGHGMQFRSESDAYFCPSEANPDDTTTLISLQGIYHYLNAGPAAVKLMVVDACRNDPRRAVTAKGVTARTAPAPPLGIATFFGCSEGQVAYEDESLQHGLFFHAVIEGTQGAAADAAGDVTIHTLSNFVQNAVSDRANRLLGKTQSPHLVANLSGPVPVLAHGKTKTTTPPPVKPETPPEKPPVTPDADVYTSAEFEMIKTRLRGGKLGKAMIGATHPTGNFGSETTPDVVLSPSGKEITATVTVRWSGGFLGTPYETDFRVRITRSNIVVTPTRDTAIIPISASTIPDAERRVGAILR